MLASSPLLIEAGAIRLVALHAIFSLIRNFGAYNFTCRGASIPTKNQTNGQKKWWIFRFKPLG